MEQNTKIILASFIFYVRKKFGSAKTRKSQLNYMTMKPRNYLIFCMLCLFLAAGCDEKQETELPEPPVADFAVGKEIFEDGEPILFVNLSENAESYLWEFGGSAVSTKENPVFTPDIQGNALSYKFRAKLTVTGEDGSTDTKEKYLIASRRMFRRIVIKDMDETLMESLPEHPEKSTEIIWLMGPAADPYTWFGDYQTLPPMVLPENPELPMESFLWHNSLPMTNTPWKLDLYVRLEGDDDPELLDSFAFIPTQMESRQVKEHIHLFELAGDKVTIDVEFEYIRK